MKKLFILAFACLAIAGCQKKDKYEEALDLYDETVDKAIEAMKTNTDPPEILETFQQLSPILVEIDSLGTDEQRARIHKIGGRLREAITGGMVMPKEEKISLPADAEVEIEHNITSTPSWQK